MSGHRLTPERLAVIRKGVMETACDQPWTWTRDLIDELDAVTRERDEALLTLAEWRTDLGPLVAQHRNGDLTAADGPYVPGERDDETIPLGFHDGDAGGQP